jgi:hypothetical protein
MLNTHRINQSRVNEVNPLSITRKPSTKDCKLQGTSWFLDPFLDNVLMFDRKRSIEGGP